MDKDSAWWVLGEATLGNVMLGAAARGLLFPPLKVVPRAALELGRIPVKTSIVLGLVGLAALGRTIYNYARFEEER